MKKISRDQVLRLHSMLINQSGGIDGNKRIGILVMLVFLKINHVEIQCQDEDVINLGLDVASGKHDTSYIMEWIILHSRY